MPVKGKLILICGYSGAGKTTLVKAVLERFPDVRYLKNYTTRPPRVNESTEGTYEYDFVDEGKYEEMRQNSQNWDHGEYYGNSYGADIDQQLSLLANGTDIILAIVPDIETVHRLSKVYDVEPIVIWIDVPLEVANSRIANSEEASRISRLNQDLPKRIDASAIKEIANYTFIPAGDIERTTKDFLELMQTILG